LQVTYSVPLYSDDERCLEAVSQLRLAFPNAEIFTRSSSQAGAEELKVAGASKVVVESGAAAANLQVWLGWTWLDLAGPGLTWLRLGYP
jgi:hypothetical protein